jgi:hypothetical protein
LEFASEYQVANTIMLVLYETEAKRLLNSSWDSCMDVMETTVMDNVKKTYFAHDMASKDDSWMDTAIDRINVYITFDLDSFDPSIIYAITETLSPGLMLV